MLPKEVTTMMKPAAQRQHRAYKERTRPILSHRTKARRAPAIEPSWTILVMLDTRLACSSLEPTEMGNPDLKLFMLTMPPTKPSSGPLLAPRIPELPKLLELSLHEVTSQTRDFQ